MTSRRLFAAAVTFALLPSIARAEGPAPSPAEKRARYSLPWSLRPAVAPNLVRVDTAIAPQDAALTVAPMLTAGYKPIAAAPDLGFYGRVGASYHRPVGGVNGAGLTNPLAFALYTPELRPHLRLSLFAGVALPLGSGGGDAPDRATRAAMASGVYARQAMDNALLLTNYITPTAGAGVAWIDGGWTFQAEATVLQLVRVRGASVDTDEARTNFTAGAHVGYRVLPPLTVSVEARHQRFLSTPAPVAVNPALRDQTTVGAGVRTNLPIGANVLARPGLAYFHPVDDPMAGAGHRVILFDVPVTF